MAEFIRISGAFTKTGQNRKDVVEPRIEDGMEGTQEEEIDEEDGRIASEASDDED